MIIRPAADADIDAIGDLHQRSRLAAYADLVPPADLAAPPGVMAAWWRERWHWEREDHRLMVAVDGGIVGFTYAGPTEEPDTAILHAIHVAPGRVGGGIGRLLLADATDWFEAGPGWRRATLWVLTANVAARGFYEHHGWTFDGSVRESPIGSAVVPQVRYSRPVGHGATPQQRPGHGR